MPRHLHVLCRGGLNRQLIDRERHVHRSAAWQIRQRALRDGFDFIWLHDAQRGVAYHGGQIVQMEATQAGHRTNPADSASLEGRFSFTYDASEGLWRTEPRRASWPWMNSAWTVTED